MQRILRHLFLAALLMGGNLPAQAQLFSSESLGGAALGGLIGGIVGHNSGRKTAEGIGIGAGAGLLLGALSSEHRGRSGYDTYIPSRRHSVYADSAPVSSRPNYAITGAALGGLAGGIIGHNNGRQTMEGVGIGAASGLLLGGIAEAAARRQESRHYYAQEAQPVPGAVYYGNPATVPTSAFPAAVTTRTVIPGAIVTTTQPSTTTGSTLITRIPSEGTAPAASPANVPAFGPPIQAQTVIINNYYGGGSSSLSSANRMFGR